VHGTPSPDGSLFAYQSPTPSGEGKIHLVTAAGTNDRTVTTHGYEDRNLVWSPDGSRLAFWRRNDLAVAEVGGDVRGFDVFPRQFGAIVWSPDGNTIYAGAQSRVFAIDFASGMTRVAPALLTAGFSFSPDGTRIAFSAGGECRDRLGIYIAQADGTGAQR